MDTLAHGQSMPDDMVIYEALAEAFAREEVSAQFVLMGDGNMHFVTALAERGVTTIHARHEHCACSMAMGHAIATGGVGVASVTCGPGVTQLMTALATAVRARIPLVVFAGDVPTNLAFYNQRIDQAPLVTATGAIYIAANSIPRMLEFVRDAFHTARLLRLPVVLSIPYDMQKRALGRRVDYQPSRAFLPSTGPMPPNAEDARRAAALVQDARRIVIVAGRGALRAGAEPELEALAKRTGALLATTLPVRGTFDDHPFSLGIAGGFARDIAREKFAESDLVIAVGASLTSYTVDGGRLFPQATVLQIDPSPSGLKDGRRAADLYLRADAKLGVQALLDALGPGTPPTGWRSEELARRIREEPADATVFEIEEGVLDPREAIALLDAQLPKEWEMVNASGHCSYFAAQMRGRRPENFHVIREFGAIGNGLSYAIGVAVARPDRPTVLVDGDGGFLMHVQELETIRRHRLKLLVCILNDGGYGSEVHKLRADGLDDSGAIFGRGDLGSVARGFGLGGVRIDTADGLSGLVEAFIAGETGAVWDIHVSDRVMSPVMRRGHGAKH